jgi:hypothetical protein
VNIEPIRNIYFFSPNRIDEFFPFFLMHLYQRLYSVSLITAKNRPKSRIRNLNGTRPTHNEQPVSLNGANVNQALTVDTFAFDVMSCAPTSDKCENFAVFTYTETTTFPPSLWMQLPCDAHMVPIGLLEAGAESFHTQFTSLHPTFFICWHAILLMDVHKHADNYRCYSELSECNCAHPMCRTQAKASPCLTSS